MTYAWVGPYLNADDSLELLNGLDTIHKLNLSLGHRINKGRNNFP